MIAANLDSSPEVTFDIVRAWPCDQPLIFAIAPQQSHSQTPPVEFLEPKWVVSFRLLHLSWGKASVLVGPSGRVPLEWSQGQIHMPATAFPTSHFYLSVSESAILFCTGPIWLYVTLNCLARWRNVAVVWAEASAFIAVMICAHSGSLSRVRRRGEPSGGRREPEL